MFKPQKLIQLLFIFLLLVQCEVKDSNTALSSNNEIKPANTILQQDKGNFLDQSFKNVLLQNNIPLDSRIDNKFESIQPGNKYSNYYLNVAIDMPDSWGLDRGVAEYTIVRAFQQDSGITLHLNVQPLLEKFAESQNSNYNIEYVNSLYGGDYKSYITQLMKTNAGIEIEDAELKEVTFGSLQFVETTYRYKQYLEDIEYYMKTSTFQTIKFNCTYTVSYSAPEIVYDINYAYSTLKTLRVLNPSFGHARN